MKFKHAFHVFVDNFSVTYKQLLYRLTILVVAAIIGTTCLYPFVHSFINSEELTALMESLRNYTKNMLNGEFSDIKSIIESVKRAYDRVAVLLKERAVQITLCGLLLLFLYIVEKWFAGLGNYTTAVLINDKMALRAKLPFLGTMISHLKEAALYNLIYVPLSILYDILVCALLLAVLYLLVSHIGGMALICVFIFTLLLIMAIALKMTFTSDWLPALIRGRKGQKGAIKYSFSRKGKNTINIYSNFIVLILIILALNVAAFLFTFGVGILLTVPASYVMIISFEMVTYYDREEIRYFVDKNTIIKPDKESVMTREQFFAGNGDDVNP